MLAAHLGGGGWKRQIWRARRCGLVVTAAWGGWCMCSVTSSRGRICSLWERTGWMHFITLPSWACICMNGTRWCMCVCVCTAGDGERLVHLAVCRTDSCPWEDWSASADGAAVRRWRCLSTGRMGSFPAVSWHPLQTLDHDRTSAPHFFLAIAFTGGGGILVGFFSQGKSCWPLR